jgi:GNAT superfamily N-acetyltransferase
MHPSRQAAEPDRKLPLTDIPLRRRAPVIRCDRRRVTAMIREIELEAYGAAVRRVGFRLRTDAELSAMHLVESEIEAERRPGASAQPPESYTAFARHLPSQFDDHTWLAETSEGASIGCSARWSNSAGDPTVMECYVYVRKLWRRRGVGWQLTRPIIDTAEAERRSSLVGNTFDSVPAGGAFALRLGA